MTKILVYPNKILRKKVSDVILIDKLVIEEVKKLKELLIDGENAAGLAAPQIGISKNFFGMKINNEIKVYFNPKLIKTWGERTFPKLVGDKDKIEDFLEGCLSVPDYFGTVRRWLKIKVEWQELVEKKFITKRKELEGFEAIVWQHESDHLKGKLFIDYIKKEGGKFFKWNGKEMIPWDLSKIIKENF